MTADRSSKLVPRLRFPEFGNMPEWEPKQLSEVLDYEQPSKYIVGGTCYQQAGTPVLTANKSFILGHTSETDGIYCDVPVIIFDDFTTDAKYVDFVFKVKSSAIKILTPRGKDELRLVYELMSRIRFDPTQHKRYFISEYQYLKIPLPGKSEQQKVADCLGSLDDLIAAEGRKLEALRQHKQGLMQQLFPQPGEARPRLRFPEFEGQPLYSVRLQDLTEESTARNGNRLSPETVMGVKKDDGIVPMEERLVAANISRYKLVRNNCFAYNPMRLNIGSIARWQGESDVLVSPDYIVFRCLERSAPAILLPEYFDSFRRSEQWNSFVSEVGDGGVRIRIYYRDIAIMQMALPNVAEQQKIADCLGSLDDLISAARRKLEALRQHKQGLMQQLFPALEVK